MKSFKHLFWLIGASILFFSCKKEKSLEAGTGPGGPTQWEFKDSSLVFNGKMDTAYKLQVGTISSVVLKGTSTDGSGDFYLEIFENNITAGTYKSPNVQFQYKVRQVIIYESVPSNTDKFSVTITSIDTDGVSGTFTGEVEDALGNTKNITNGTFTASFNTSSNPPPSGNGQLTLWSKTGCGNGSIAVKVQSQTGSISSFPSTAPACGAAGAASFNLAPGAYSWEAYCNSDTMRGNVNVVAGNCTKVEVVFGAASTNCIISNLGYYDPPTNTALGSLTSIFNASNQVTSVLFVDSSTNKAEYSFTPNKSGSRVNIGGQQYFDLDASGRIKEFHGFVDAIDTSLPRIVAVYTFDAAGYIQKAAYAFEQAPTINILNVNYTWSGGNLTKAVVQQVGTTERIEYTYQYDLTRTAKNFLSFFPNREITFLQSAINFGKNSSHVLTTSSITEYNASGAMVGTPEVATYNNYIFDQNYVKQFSITGDGSVYQGDTKYVLSYKCF